MNYFRKPAVMRFFEVNSEFGDLCYNDIDCDVARGIVMTKVKKEEDKKTIQGRLDRDESTHAINIHFRKELLNFLDEDFKSSKPALINFLILHYYGVVDLHKEKKLNVYQLDELIETLIKMRQK